ncbi:MAG TPA: hypothetical protein VGE67_15100, partial [Haloferula sp.]
MATKVAGWATTRPPFFQADEGDEEPDAGADGRLHEAGDGADDFLADAAEREGEEDDAVHA